MTTPLEASVIIPCYTEERWDWTLEAIDSAKAQTRRPAEIVVVVDHNEHLLSRLRREVDGIVCLGNELQRGVSGARNSAVASCETDVVAFLDDDAVAHPDWLAELLEPLSDEAVVGTGGVVLPSWQGRPPRWLPAEFAWVVGAFHASVPESPAPVRNVWGMSMAVRRALFEEVGGFRTGFGKLDDLSRPEDTDFCIRVGRLVPDGRWVLVPGAVIEHRVPERRASFSFFLRRCHNEGRQKIALAELLGGRDSLGPEAEYIRRTLPSAMAAQLRAALRERRSEPLLVAGAMALGMGAAATGAAEELALRYGGRARTPRPAFTGPPAPAAPRAEAS